MHHKQDFIQTARYFSSQPPTAPPPFPC
ncbi:Protein of unknown function [Pyronema omphalodes CBS 100304]|uniref:Uncharacterized protein n=1 Tax=Pyronema omphalodes (strain CBS 100304) TaxID=1076935 RepID=U4L9F3_PYROM|nr:Protein of unknown function [Pyronema omphalodes CBS 100304]